MASDGVSLTEINNRARGSAERDQTLHTCLLALVLYTRFKRSIWSSSAGQGLSFKVKPV